MNWADAIRAVHERRAALTRAPEPAITDAERTARFRDVQEAATRRKAEPPAMSETQAKLIAAELYRRHGHEGTRSLIGALHDALAARHGDSVERIRRMGW